MSDRLEEIIARWEAQGRPDGDKEWLIADDKRLRKEADVTFVNAAHDAVAKLEAAEAEIERLREAVRAEKRIKQNVIDGALHDVSERCKAAEAQLAEAREEISMCRADLEDAQSVITEVRQCACCCSKCFEKLASYGPCQALAEEGTADGR